MAPIFRVWILECESTWSWLMNDETSIARTAAWTKISGFYVNCKIMALPTLHLHLLKNVTAGIKIMSVFDDLYVICYTWPISYHHHYCAVTLGRHQSGWLHHFEGLVQDCSSSCALAVGLLLSCTEPSIYSLTWVVAWHVGAKSFPEPVNPVTLAIFPESPVVINALGLYETKKITLTNWNVALFNYWLISHSWWPGTMPSPVTMLIKFCVTCNKWRLYYPWSSL